HAQVRWRGLHLRGLFTRATVEQADRLNAALGTAPGSAGIAEEMLGAYAEIAYDVWQWLAPDSEMTLEPFYRYEWVDTQQTAASGYVRDETQRNHSHTVGVSYKPIPNVVLKADYRNVKAQQGSPADEINLGIGLVF
ncbi:MAG: inverse autotransporter beta domain-containing protein, partial [Myxococcales bacterium]|nr:inverse autotransporter beta domain-containing protein [Myxococcales bacterium]